MRHAVLELGDHAVHLLVVEVAVDGAVETIAREERSLRLAAALGSDDELSSGLTELALETVRRMHHTAARLGAGLHAIATDRVADATELLRGVGREVGAPVRAVRDREARILAYRGVVDPVADHRSVTIGIEDRRVAVGVGERGNLLWSIDAPVGPAGLLDGAPVPQRVLTEAVSEQLRPVALLSRRLGPTVPLVHGPHVRALVEVLRLTSETPVAASGAADVSLSDLASVAVRLSRLDDQELPDRVRSFLSLRRGDAPGATAILASVAAAVIEIAGLLDASSVRLRDGGLREGVVRRIADAVARAGRPQMHPTLRDARGARVRRVQRLLGGDPAHADHVARLTLRLHEATSGLHGGGTRDGELLAYGARLHDVGAGLVPGAHHRVGAQLVEHAVLEGFEDDDAAAVASLVRFHKGAGPSGGYAPYTSLRPDRRDQVDLLTGLLRVACGLDRGHSGAVQRVQVDGDVAGALRVVIGGDGDLALARWGATANVTLLERVVRRRVEVVTEEVAHRVVPDVLVLPARYT